MAAGYAVNMILGLAAVKWSQMEKEHLVACVYARATMYTPHASI